MTTSNSTGTPPGKAPFPNVVELPGGIRKTERTTHDEYLGDAEAILAAGIVTRDMLPGQPGRGQTSSCIRGEMNEYGSYVGGPGYTKIGKRINNRLFVEIWLSKEEAARRNEIMRPLFEAENERREREEQLAKERWNRQMGQQVAENLDSLKLKIACGITTKEKYREKTLDIAWRHGSMLVDYLRGMNGYSFDDDTTEAVMAAGRQMWAALQKGKILFDQQQQIEQRISLSTKRARSDLTLQRFLSNTLAATALANGVDPNDG